MERYKESPQNLIFLDRQNQLGVGSPTNFHVVSHKEL